MGFFDALVVIIAIAAFAYLRGQKYRAQGGENAPSGAAYSELEKEVVRLRERVTVLERIATEERDERDLAREIEKLRD
ncbi:MAG: hypothetical protein R3D89_01200 [Sphingomonadaceae bacterium]|jgi:hypothetical protein